MRGFAVATTLLGCYHPGLATEVPCGPGGACPNGQKCDWNRQPPVCVHNPSSPDLDSGMDAAAPRLDVCGDMTGLLAGSPWPVVHGCPTNAGQSSFRGPATAGTGVAPVGTNNAKKAALVAASNQVVIQERSVGMLISYDVVTGVERWTNTSTNGSGIEPGPVIDHLGRVIAATNYGKLFCFDLATGAELWQMQLSGSYSAPVIGPPGIVYFGSVGPWGFYAVDTEARVQKWHFDVPNSGDASTAPALGDWLVYIVDTKNSQLYALETTAGATQFAVAVPGGAVGSPVLGVDTLYVATTTNGIVAFDWLSGAVKWQQLAGQSVVQPALLSTGHVVTSTVDGGAVVLDRATGEQLQSWSVGGTVKTPPIIDVDDTIYFATSTGTIAFSAKGVQRWQSPLVGTPVLGDHKIIILPAAQTLAVIGE